MEKKNEVIAIHPEGRPECRHQILLPLDRQLSSGDHGYIRYQIPFQSTEKVLRYFSLGGRKKKWWADRPTLPSLELRHQHDYKG